MSAKSFYLLFATIVASLVFVLFLNCNQNPFFGVGEDVDTVRPTVAVTSHKNGSWEKPSFNLSGVCKDNVGIEKVVIKQIKKDSSGNEYAVDTWNAFVSGERWDKTFDLTGDFDGETGFKTLDVYAYDAKENYSNIRILLGITKDISEVFLTNPRDVDIPGNSDFFEGLIKESDIEIFYRDHSSDNADNLKYYFNKILNISGYTKASNPPDNQIKLSLYNSGKNDLLYSYTITGDISNDNAKGNTVAWTFRLDTESLKDKYNNKIDNTSCYLEIIPVDQAGTEWIQGKGYIYISQITDYPNVEVVSPELPADPSKITISLPQTYASGKVWDDDGIRKIYWYLGKKDPTSDFFTPSDWLKNSNWLSRGWVKDNDGRINISDKNEASGVIDLSSDPTLYPWSFRTSAGIGEYKLYIIAVDKYGAVSLNRTPRIFRQQTVDLPEVLSFTLPDTTKTYRGNVIVDVKLSAGSSKTLSKVYYKMESSLFKDPSWTEKSDISKDLTADYIFSFDSSKYISADEPYIKIFVKCENEYQEVSNEKYVQVKVDNTSPILSFTYPSENLGIYAVTQIRGTVEDPLAGVKSLYIGYFKTQPDMMTKYSTEGQLDADVTVLPTLDRWVKIQNPKYSWDVTIDTTALYTDKTEHLYNLYIAAVDNVGNTGYKTIAYKINQSLDTPVVKEINLSNVGKVPSEIGIEIEDQNDGVTTNSDGIKAIYWYIARSSITPPLYTSWSSHTDDNYTSGIIDLSASLPTKSINYIKTPTGSGTYKVYVMAVDRNNNKSDNPVTSTEFVQKITDIPIITINSAGLATPYNGKADIDVTVVGGSIDTIKKISYRLYSSLKTDDVTHDLVITPPVVTLNNYKFSIDIDSFINLTVHDVKLYYNATNSIDKVSVALPPYSISGDNTKPVINITNPSENTGINGLVNITRVVSDDFSGVKSVYMGYFKSAPNMTDYDTEDEIVAKASDVTADVDGVNKVWLRLSDTSASKDVKFDTTKIYSDEIEHSYSLYMAVVDNAGNVGYKTRSYKIDQSLDRPTSYISTPQTAAIVFPSSVVSGTVNDDDGIDYVYWYIGTGAAPADYKTWNSVISGTAEKGGLIDLTTSRPTSYSLGSNDIITPTGSGNYTIYLMPVDIGGKTPLTAITRGYTQKASDIPSISFVTSYPDTVLTHNGFVAVRVNANGGSIDKITKIFYDISSDILKSGWQERVSPTHFTSDNTINGHEFQFDINPYVSMTVHDVVISVYCENEVLKSSQVTTITIKGDNTVPVVAITSPSWGTDDLNGEWSILGTVSDDWSGVKNLYYGYFDANPDMTNDFNTVAELEAKADTNLNNIDKISKFWHKVTFSQPAWSYDFNTTKVGNGSYNLYVAAADEVGKVSWVYRPFGIDQEADLPTSSISSPSGGSSVYPGAVATGNASDDDGLKYVYWYIGTDTSPDTYTNWCNPDGSDLTPTPYLKGGRINLSTSNNPKSYTWKVDETPSGTGSFKVWIRTVDMNDKVQKVYTTLSYTQSSSSSPTVNITNDTAQNYTKNITISISALGAGKNVTNAYYKLESSLTPISHKRKK